MPRRWIKDIWLDFRDVSDSAEYIDKIVEILESEGYMCRVLEGREREEFLREELGLKPEEVETWPAEYTVCTKGRKRVVMEW